MIRSTIKVTYYKEPSNPFRKSGNSGVPLCKSHPAKTLDYYIGDSKSKILIATKNYVDKVLLYFETILRFSICSILSKIANRLDIKADFRNVTKFSIKNLLSGFSSCTRKWQPKASRSWRHHSKFDVQKRRQRRQCCRQKCRLDLHEWNNGITQGRCSNSSDSKRSNWQSAWSLELLKGGKGSSIIEVTQFSIIFDTPSSHILVLRL